MKRVFSNSPNRLAMLVVAFCAAFWSTAAFGQPAEQRYLEGLRGRGLSQLAEAYCSQQLKRSDLEPIRRADLTVEMARSLSDRALSSPPGDRAALWDAAQKVINAFVTRYPDNPRTPIVRLEGALALLTRGELARQESELLADATKPLEEARNVLFASIQGLRKSTEELEVLQRRRNQLPKHDKSILSVYELADLTKRIQYETARAYRNIAQSYPPGSPDRANGLSQAIQYLEPLTMLDTSERYCFKSRIDMIRCLRLQGDFVKANEVIQTTVALEPSPRIRLLMMAEHLEIMLAAGDLQTAVDLLAEPRTLYNITSPELDFGRLKVQVAAGQHARKIGRDFAHRSPQEWEEEAIENTEEIERLYGPYWTRRAGMLLGGVEGSSSESLVRKAESLYRAGDFAGAMAMYDKAVATAADRGDVDKAFELGYVAAAVAVKQEAFDKAMVRYRDLSLAYLQNKKAPQAHQLAIYYLGRSLKDDSTPRDQFDKRLQQYKEWMQEHVGTWPDAASSDEIRFLLGQMRQMNLKWKEAIELYCGMSRGSARSADAVKAAARCYHAWLKDLKANGKSTEEIAGDGAEWFKSLLFDADGRLPEMWSPTQMLAALEASRLLLNYTSNGYLQAHQILAAAMENNPNAPPEWTAAARSLLVFSLAGQGRISDAKAVLAQISAGPTDQLLSLLQGLGRVVGDAPPQVRNQLAELQLSTIKLLTDDASKLSPEERRSFERIRAEVLAATGRSGDALAAYAALAGKFPNDGTIQEEYLRLLMEQGDNASLATAIKKCREMEKKSKPQSPRWYRAKYNLATLHFRMGDKAKAAKMIQLLKLLHPTLGGPAMKAKFEALLAQCR